MKYHLDFLMKGLLKKHEAFQSDLEVHKERCFDIKREGQTLIDEVELCSIRSFKYFVWYSAYVDGVIRCLE